MNFLLDHDVPDRVAEVLLVEGHGVVRLREALPVEARDPEVLAHAHQHGLILVTCNRDDFLPLAAAQPHVGLIVLIRRQSRLAECAAILRLLRRADESGLAGNVNFA